MRIILPVKDITDKDISRTGGKAHALAVMMQRGMNVPEAITVTSEAYDTYVSTTGLRTKIMMELNRKTYEDIRWEELWDSSLRIQNLFVKTPLPTELHNTIKESVEICFADRSVVVRSSARGEDTSETSFAGLHASYVNVSGAESILEHIKLVWASLWSDASLLYRKELGLDERRSSMAVVVQEIISGEVSGIGFGQDPNDSAQCIIEAVYGLNQGLVDGTLEPDRWILNRTTGNIITHTPALRTHVLSPSERGTDLASLSPKLKNRPPLSDEDVRKVYGLVMEAEGIFGLPQDVEWTIKNGITYVLQSRPITTLLGKGKDEKRGWYLSLKKSFENLKNLRHTIEDELIPDLQKETEDLSKMNISMMSDHEIRNEAERRRDIFEKWKKIYWDFFIPFAHGMRLFGMVYNETIHPQDPYEFVRLLSTGNMVSLQRNDILQEMASHVQRNEVLSHDLKSGNYKDPEFQNLLQQFITYHGDLLCSSTDCENEIPGIVNMVIEMASAPVRSTGDSEEIYEREKVFLSHFNGQKRTNAEEMLDIARASYTMRDNDNIYMGKLKARVLETEEELLRRSESPERSISSAGHFDSLSLTAHLPEEEVAGKITESFRFNARQVTGQPAGPGIATGPARVIQTVSDLMNFKKDEVLVCDAIDPNMTFVVPLACAIVERRGGMLIHGAIIAREYGIPCVTGIQNATGIIKTGTRVTVDGFLGIVIIG